VRALTGGEEHYAARSDIIEPAEHLQQRRLSRAGGADEHREPRGEYFPKCSCLLAPGLNFDFRVIAVPGKCAKGTVYDGEKIMIAAMAFAPWSPALSYGAADKVGRADEALKLMGKAIARHLDGIDDTLQEFAKAGEHLRPYRTVGFERHVADKGRQQPTRQKRVALLGVLLECGDHKCACLTWVDLVCETGRSGRGCSFSTTLPGSIGRSMVVTEMASTDARSSS